MVFTSFVYLIFLVVVVVLYWILRRKTPQNLMLLVASYLFYGWVHPWFCWLIAASTLLDYFCGLGMARHPNRRRLLLTLSLVGNLGLLGYFKYFNFFVGSFEEALRALGLPTSRSTLNIFLPVGISFYTFQTLSYTIDVYRGRLEPCRNCIDFALFVSAFPQLVAGPIERATHFLPQIETPRRFDLHLFATAWPLLFRGYVLKLFVADNAAVYADRIFALQSPTVALLAAGSVAFAVQIYADFSAYTCIARGSARLLGLDLMENFQSPYLAISPSDFWRRWHISFSTWIRDYLYISLGGSRVDRLWKFALVVTATLGLSGLWHGASWNFVVWGLYHGALVFAYHAAGKGGRWRPATPVGTLAAWSLMSLLTLFGWTLFRCRDLGWLIRAWTFDFQPGLSGDSLVVAAGVLALLVFYSLPLLVLLLMDRAAPRARLVHAVAYGVLLLGLLVYTREIQQDFIYFQF